MAGVSDLLSGVAAITVPLAFVASLSGHVLRPRGLPGALRAHRVLPARLIPPVAVLVIAAETAIVLGGAAAVSRAEIARPLLAAAAALLAAFTGYGWYVARTRPAVPCGCGGPAGAAMTGWVAARAGALALLATVGAVFAGSTGGPLGRPDGAIRLLAGATFAVLLWILPEAMRREPQREMRTVRPPAGRSEAR